MGELLWVERVTAGYDEEVVIEDVSLRVEQHAGLALLGRNGVGKTTLLATIMGLTQLHAGRIAFAGTDLAGLAVHQRAPAGLGYVPQEREIFPSLSVHENMTVAGRPGPWTAERIYDLFPRLAERRRNYGNQLSGGEQQMLAIGRALVCNPRMLLLDEPFEGLAPIIVDGLLSALNRIRSEDRMAMILVDQQASLILEIMPQAVVLDRGRVVWTGESSTLLGDRELLSSMVGV